MVFGNRNSAQQPNAGGMVFGGDGAGVHVMGEQLREVDTPIEALVGAANGIVHGAGIGAAVSAALTWADTAHGEQVSGKQILNNIRSNHLGGIIGAALAFSAISGFVRYSRASKHNEWSQKHYDFLREQNSAEPAESPKSFSEREETRKAIPANKEIGV